MINFVIDRIESPTAGTEKQLLNLLTRIDKSRFRPMLTVLRTSPWIEQEFKAGPFHSLEISSFKDIHIYGKIHGYARFLEREGTDIVHTYFSDANKVGIMAGRMMKVPLIISSRRNQGYWHNTWEKLQLKMLNPMVDHFVANSESTLNWASRAEGISRDRITVINNGIDLKEFDGAAPGARARYRREWGIPESAPVAGIVANLRPVKRIDLFLTAAAAVNESLPGARFVIVGEGETATADGLRRLAHDLGLSGRVTFLGRRTDVPSILRAFDVGVLTSDSESSSNAVIEYMAAGLPVVCTDIGGAREAVEDGLSGHIVPCGDYVAMAECMVRIFTGGQGEAMGRRGCERAREKFSMGTMVSSHERMYEDLMDRLGAPRRVDRMRRLRDGMAFNAVKVASDRIFYRARKLGRAGGRGAGRDSFLILAFHKVSPYMDPLGLSIMPEVFEQQMAFLKGYGQVVSLKDMLARLQKPPLGGNIIAMTFDDGYQDNYIDAFPILKRYGLPATIFVTVEAVEKGWLYWDTLDRSVMECRQDVVNLSPWGLGEMPVGSARDKYRTLQKLHAILKRADHLVTKEIIGHITAGGGGADSSGRHMLTWDEMREMQKSGLIEIGSHSFSHPILTRVDKATALQEVRESKRFIEEKLGEPVETFSYPNGCQGDFDEAIVSMLKDCGYRAAVTMLQGISSRSVDPYRLPRMDVTESNSCDTKGRFDRSRFAMSMIRSANLFG